MEVLITFKFPEVACMRLRKALLAVLLSLIFVAVQFGPAFAADGLSVTPGTVSVNEGASANSFLTGVSPSTSTDFFGKYIQVSVDGADGHDSISIATVSSPATTAGTVSVVGSFVYVGDGLFARRIGQIDPILSGGAATALRVNLDTFDTIPAANYSTAWVGWTNFNPSNVSSASVFGESFVPGAGMIFEKLGRWSGTGGGPSSMFTNSSFTALTNSSVIRTSPGRFNNSLSIYLDMSATGLPSGGGSIRGAGVTSPEFNATAGDRVSFTHRNLCSACSSTADVSMWVGLVDVSTQQFVSVGHAVMDQGQNWADDYTISVPTTGRFKLAITAGALWPGATGNRLQTDVKLDMFELSPPLTATWVGNLLKAIKYQNTAVNPTTSKTIRYQIGTGNTATATATQTVNFTLVDDPAVPVNSSIEIDNTEGVQDSFANESGLFGGTDGDSALQYSAQNGTTVSSTFAGITYDQKVTASLGSLYFQTSTGQWAFVPNANLIDSQTVASSSAFSMNLNGVPFTFTVSTRMVAAPPPSITVETSSGEVMSSASPVAEPPSVIPPVVPASAAAPSSAATKSSEKSSAVPSLSEALLNALSDPAAAVAALLSAAFAPPTIITDPTAAVANPSIGASGDDSAPVEAFDPLGSPESIAALSGALVMAVSLAAGVAAATAGGSSSSGSSDGGAGSSDGAAELEGLEASEDVLSINRSAWGDKLPIFGSALLVFFDRLSHDAAIKAARFSPMFAKLIIDGAYIRAMAGSLSLLLPIATLTLSVIAANANQGQLLPPQWGLLLAMALIGVFDAFAGFLGAVVFIAISLISSNEQIQASDLRMFFGVLFISMGPGLLMTAFRALRKDSAPGFVGVWDRATDFVIAPVMAGVSVTTAVTVLPALAGLTLPVANHVAAFGIFVAVAAMVRVLLEEFATKAFPARLNAINPSSLPEPPAIQQWSAILISYGMWVFLTGALSGEVWQVYVGSFFFLLPTILAKFSDSFPNSVVLWRLMPQGMPGLVFTLLVSAASAMIVMAFIGANPAFAAWNMILLPLPLLAISILGLLGRYGATPDEVRFSQRNPLFFRLGGVLILIVALRMMGIF